MPRHTRGGGSGTQARSGALAISAGRRFALRGREPGLDRRVPSGRGADFRRGHRPGICRIDVASTGTRTGGGARPGIGVGAATARALRHCDRSARSVRGHPRGGGRLPRGRAVPRRRADIGLVVNATFVQRLLLTQRIAQGRVDTVPGGGAIAPRIGVSDFDGRFAGRSQCCVAWSARSFWAIGALHREG